MALIDATAEIELVDGSLKATAILAGALMVYGAVADYKGFKESLAEIGHDARQFAIAIRDTIPKVVSEKHDLTGQEVRKGKIVVTAEEISKLIERLEKLKENSQTMSETELSAELDKIARGFRFLRKQLDQKDMAAVEQYMVNGNLPVPGRYPRPLVGAQGKEIIQPDTFEELRRRIEEAEISSGPLAMQAPDVAKRSAPARRRRRMYFKRASVRPTVKNLKLL
jgi:hypothetical protein